MRELEKEKMAQMETFLSDGVEEPDYLANLFSSSVQQEMAAYSKSWEACNLLELQNMSPERQEQYMFLQFTL